MASITRINVKTAPKAAEAKKEAAATPVDEMALAAAGEASEAAHTATAGDTPSVEEAAAADMAQVAESDARSFSTAVRHTPELSLCTPERLVWGRKAEWRLLVCPIAKTDIMVCKLTLLT